MNIIQYDKVYKKENKSTQHTIDKGIGKLEVRLSEYYKQNKKIETIFNDDILIHDIINKKFYVYKCAIEKVQLRILYTVCDDQLIIIGHYCKKKPSKEYITLFEKTSSMYMDER